MHTASMTTSMHQPSRGSRSAALTCNGCPRYSTRVRAGWWWCGPSPRPRIRSRQPAISARHLQQRGDAAQLEQPMPACRETGMQRQLGHLFLDYPPQFIAFMVGHGVERMRRVRDDGRIGPVGCRWRWPSPLSPGRRRCSAARPASSWASRTAASSALSWLSRAPPGRPHVPPWWLHAARCCSNTARLPFGSGARSNRPAAPCRPQNIPPVSDSTQPSPSPRTVSG